jgi:hypothetical protein
VEVILAKRNRVDRALSSYLHSLHTSHHNNIIILKHLILYSRRGDRYSTVRWAGISQLRSQTILSYAYQSRRKYG